MDTPSQTIQRGHRRTLQGTVVSVAMQKTVVVRVDRMHQHPIYKKRYRVSKKYHAHAATGAYAIGDRVIIAETRPLSRTKNWRVVGKVTS